MKDSYEAYELYLYPYTVCVAFSTYVCFLFFNPVFSDTETNKNEECLFETSRLSLLLFFCQKPDITSKVKVSG